MGKRIFRDIITRLLLKQSTAGQHAFVPVSESRTISNYARIRRASGKFILIGNMGNAKSNKGLYLVINTGVLSVIVHGMGALTMRIQLLVSETFNFVARPLINLTMAEYQKSSDQTDSIFDVQLGTKESSDNRICVVVVSNDSRILARNLLSSNMIRDDLIDLKVIRNAHSATTAYNSALDETNSEIVIFAHQDVYFPPGWETQLTDAIAKVKKIDENWALIAPIGISFHGEHVGQVWSTSQDSMVGCQITTPEIVQSVDELTIVLRRASGVRFDDALPTFHLYGTDIVQIALAGNMGAYACQLPVVHNDRFHENLKSDFGLDYRFVRSKWFAKLPLKTTVLEVTKFGLSLFFYRLRARWFLRKRRSESGDTETDPRCFSERCGWEGD